MLWRLLGHFSYDKQAGIALTTALSILSLILLIYTGLDLARYHMINRGLSSAAQQTVEWMANRGASATEDPNVLTRDAIVGRMGKNIIPSTALYSGITSVTTTFSYDGPTGVSRLIVKANYNLMLRKTFNLQPPQCQPMRSSNSIRCLSASSSARAKCVLRGMTSTGRG